MPITSAARRASLASSMVQQPRAPERYDAGLRESARWMPVTSWPASTARAAATAESTPPDIAAMSLIACGSGPSRPSGRARGRRAARRAGGDLHALGVEQHEQRVALAARERHVRDVRQTVRGAGLGVAVHDRLG